MCTHVTAFPTLLNNRVYFVYVHCTVHSAAADLIIPKSLLLHNSFNTHTHTVHIKCKHAHTHRHTGGNTWESNLKTSAHYIHICALKLT